MHRTGQLNRGVAAVVRAQVVGFALGVLHAALLGAAGLYAESGVREVTASALRYGAFGLLLGTGLGIVFQLASAVIWRGAQARVAPVRAWTGAAYLGIWALFLFKQSGAAGAGGAVEGVLALVALLVLLGLGRFEPSIPRRGEGRVLALVGILLAVGLLRLPGSGTPAQPASSGGNALEPFRPAALEAFSPGRWNVLLLTFDTLRADHLGSYGYQTARTTALDSLAGSGVQFENAIVQRPKTSPNVATFLTGTYPARHGIHRPMRRLPERAETLAEILGAAGWTTGAVITNGNLYPEFGFDQGFQEYHHGHRDAAEGADLALDWLERHGEEDGPWHLWVHTTDPHWPYDPPQKWKDHFADPSHDENARQVALYDGEIAWSSEQTGRILAWLGAHPEVRERTLVVFTADHGESLGEHDYSFEHGMLPYEPSVRVPLVFSMPGRIPAHQARDAVVASVDLVPTILDVVDVDIPGVVQGHSILPLVQGLRGEGPRDFVYLEAGYGEHVGPGRTQAFRTRTTKYVHRLKGWALRPSARALPWTFDAALEGGLAPDEFYDLQSDPEELRSDRARSGDARVRLEAFHAWLAGQVAVSGADDGVALDPETEESLRSLGYIE